MYAETPGHARTATSKQAAHKTKARRAPMKALILERIRLTGRMGATGDEIERDSGYVHQTVSARVRDLLQDGSLVLKTTTDGAPVTRTTRSGNAANVYLYVPPAQREPLEVPSDPFGTTARALLRLVKAGEFDYGNLDKAISVMRRYLLPKRVPPTR